MPPFAEAGEIGYELDVFGEQFEVSKDLVYSYVKAIIVTEIGSLQLYLADEYVGSFEYQLTA